ncbi:MAG: NTF2-like N-terminal transpeptidase domain-containing protein, partial [Actinomycetota bacterium]
MRARDLLTIVVVVLVVAAVGVVGWRALEGMLGDEEEPEPDQQPASAADAYLAAWSEGDLAGMRAWLSDEPEGFEQAHQQLDEALAPRELRVERDEIEEPEDGRAVTTVTVELALDEPLGDVAWETELELVRERGSWAVSWTPATLHPELREEWGFAITSTPVDREPILASDGTVLAGGEAATIGFVPRSIDDPEEVIEAFAEALPGSEVVAERELGRDELVDDWYYPVVTVSAARAELAWQQLRRTDGITAPRSADEARVLLDAGFAQHVVGVVSEATAEQLDEDPDLEAGDQLGQFGLEAALEEQLLGSERIEVGLRELGSDEQLRHVIADGQEDPSQPIRTTLDVGVQRAIELTLGEVDDPAAIVVVDAEDGAIRGSASRPLTAFNRVFAGSYPPGSTFKIVTAEAALASGLDIDDEVACPQEAIVGGLA